MQQIFVTQIPLLKGLFLSVSLQLAEAVLKDQTRLQTYTCHCLQSSCIWLVPVSPSHNS